MLTPVHLGVIWEKVRGRRWYELFPERLHESTTARDIRPEKNYDAGSLSLPVS
jgi:hypothetical protein